MIASKTQGVAPLAVHFDALVQGVSEPPLVNGRREYADFDYQWDINGVIKKGYVQGHVFETPGVYTVTLTVNGGEIHQEVITVLDPDAFYSGQNTICISYANNFTGAPEGCVKLTNPYDVVNYFAPNKRILFRRGETYTTDASVQLTALTGITFGAFGAGAAPKFVMQGSNTNGLFYLHNQTDTRLMDMHIVDAGSRGAAVNGLTGLNEMLLLRLKTEGFTVPFDFSHWATAGHDQLAVVDCDAKNSRKNIMYIGSERLMLMGNTFADPADSHVIRCWSSYKGVISGNNLSGSSSQSTSGRQALKLHGASEADLQGGDAGLARRTQYTVVSDNFIGSSGIWPMSIGPQNNQSDERISDILVENNTYDAGVGTQSSLVQNSLVLWGSYITARNNVCKGDPSDLSFIGISVRKSGATVAPKGNRIFNNQIYKATDNNGTTQFAGVLVQAEAIDTEVAGNQSFVTTAIPTRVAIADSGQGTIETNNTLEDL